MVPSFRPEILVGSDSPEGRHHPGAPAVESVPSGKTCFFFCCQRRTFAIQIFGWLELLLAAGGGLQRCQVIGRVDLSAESSGGRLLLVESHFAAFLQGVGMGCGKNGKLFEDIPARSFCRSAAHAVDPVKRGERVRPPATARHGYLATISINSIREQHAWITMADLLHIPRLDKCLQSIRSPDTLQLQYSE